MLACIETNHCTSAQKHYCVPNLFTRCIVNIANSYYAPVKVRSWRSQTDDFDTSFSLWTAVWREFVPWFNSALYYKSRGAHWYWGAAHCCTFWLYTPLSKPTIGVAREGTGCTCTPRAEEKMGEGKFTGKSYKCTPTQRKKSIFFKLGRCGRWEWII